MLRLIYCALTLGVLSMAGCRSGRPVVGTSDDRAAIPVMAVAAESDMLSAAIADTENEVCPDDSGDPESSERRRLYRRSAEPADYVSNVESYNPISFAFEYEPNVQGYRVEGRLFAFDTPQGLGNRLEGSCRLSFYNESTGCRYDIFCEHYCDESSIPGWYDETGEYVFNPEVGNTEGTLRFDYNTLQGEEDRGPFVFEDVDFDGKDEILIRRTSPLRNSGHYYEVYKPVGADRCVLLNYPPFNGFYCDRCGWDEVSPEKNSITRYHSDHKMQIFRFHRRIGISGFNYSYAVDTIRAELFYE